MVLPEKSANLTDDQSRLKVRRALAGGMTSALAGAKGPKKPFLPLGRRNHPPVGYTTIGFSNAKG